MTDPAQLSLWSDVPSERSEVAIRHDLTPAADAFHSRYHARGQELAEVTEYVTDRLVEAARTAEAFSAQQLELFDRVWVGLGALAPVCSESVTSLIVRYYPRKLRAQEFERAVETILGCFSLEPWESLAASRSESTTEPQ